ncbi:MAG: hypothetical protein KDA77_13575 [Planctomycetaceae bacterium]|nr:hypothetical protein [Planctomycetaceae bacterium]
MLNPPPLITGNDLIAAGIQSGPEFKDLLARIQDAQLEESIHTHEEALALLARLHQK